VGDFNGDGKADIALTPTVGSGVWVLLGNGDLTFQDPAWYPTAGQATSSVAIGDFNSDGVTDLVVANASGSPSVSILLGKGDGTFQAAVSYPAGNAPYAVAVGDFNGDGIADLAVTNYNFSNTGVSLNILLGNGDGTFRSAVSYPVSDSQVSLALGDFNGDGRVDIAAPNYGSKTVSIFLGVASCNLSGDAAPSVADVQLIVNQALGKATAFNDLNGDGVVNVVDVQIEMNAVLGLITCR
jgi:hypothetical protein